MQATIQRTRLYAEHQKLGANMADFGGYEMPLWYPAGVRAEHLSVLRAAGMFDTSHMALVRVSGSDSRRLLQALFTKDLDRCTGPKGLPLAPGRCAYGAFCNEKGHVLDDALVYMLERDHYLVVVNAGMGGVLAAHLRSFTGNHAAVVEDLTDQVGKVDVQGPMAGKILSLVLKDAEAVLSSMPYFSFKGDWTLFGKSALCLLKDDTSVLLSRTGYTGEFGFEIFCAMDAVERVWHLLLAAGSPMGLIPCGLAARDSLRTGALLPLSHQDIGNWPFVNHPWTFALPFMENGKGFTKGFLGDEALMMAADDVPHTLAFVAADLRKVTAGPDTKVLLGGEVIGRVLTCVTDMGMAMRDGVLYSVNSPDKPEDLVIKGLACGFVLVDTRLEPGTMLELKDEKRKLPVRVVQDLRPARTARKALASLLDK
ncbi:aminomethyltransferase family protein [Desulfobotulus sp. H1]|uniref:Aminomethyltransferase family protein n=1 Tax=Desulfobotulus pelophilus TaxID=2823377 RepID=A0ABT3NAE5_9BACT|nr:aminomethyltransferase family protein [Desulfobotulus pelophilus]MCW7754432.1 aminomethyltransferase family protein [Desulfobotulus pelophilus]